MSLSYLRVGSCYLREGEKRLDANYYNLALWARWALERSRWPRQPLEALASFTYLGRFKRRYVSPSEGGVPFLGSREVFFWPLKAEKYLHPNAVEPGLFPGECDILIACSGSVGYSVLAGRSLAKVAVSQHVLRVHAQQVEPGYLYLFLRTQYGFSYLQGAQYGAVIKEIDPSVIGTMPVPLLAKVLRRRFHRIALSALAKREKGQALLEEARGRLYQRLGLPSPEQVKPSYLSSSHGVRSFSVGHSDLEGRLDASYHVPEARSLLKALAGGKYELVPLADLASIHIPPRFKRHYVAPEIGVPFIRPSDLATVRVLEPRYIARWTPELDSARLQLGEVVISRSGSIGEVGLITQAWDGWAGSDDLARVAAKEGLSDPGYLYIFLTSPYGQIQIQRQIYGGVIDHLEVEHLAQIRVPRAPLDVQQEIGDLVWKAFALRDEANALEEAAVRQLEEVIRKGPRPHLVLGQAE